MKTDLIDKPAWKSLADIAVAWILLSTGLVALQWITLPKLTRTLALRWSTLSEYLSVLTEAPLDGVDLGLAVLVCATFTYLVLIDLLKGRHTTFLKRVLARERSTKLLVLTCAFLAGRFYFAPGRQTWSGDGAFHAMHGWIATEAFREGLVPVWTPLLSAGTPFVQFYGFAYAYTCGLFGLIFDDLYTVEKTVLGLSHVCSGLTCYLYARTVTRSRFAGFAASLAYVLIVWHTQQILIMGRFPISLLYVFLPLPFYAVEQIRRRPSQSRQYVLAGSVSIAILAFIHPGYAFWAVAFLSLYVVLLLRNQRTRVNLPIRHVATLLIGGLLLASYLVIPIWLERDWTNLHQGFNLTREPAPTLGHLLIWGNYRTRLIGFPDGSAHWYGGYLGLSVVVISAIGLVLLKKKSRWPLPTTYPFLALAASSFLVFGSRLPILSDIAVVQALSPGRYLVFVCLFLSICFGISCKALTAFERPGLPILTLCLGIVILDLGSASFRQAFHEFPNERIVRMSASQYQSIITRQAGLPDDQFVSERIRYPHSTRNGILTYHGRSTTITGLFDEHPRADTEFIRPFLEKLQADLKRTKLSDFLQTTTGRVAYHGLKLLNTRLYLDHLGGKLLNFDVRQTVPVTVSGVLGVWEDVPGQSPGNRAFSLIDRMGLDPLTSVCERILVDRDPRGNPSATLTIRDQSHIVHVDRAYMSFTVSAPCYARLSYAYYPYLDLKLDGSPTEFFKTADGFIGMSLPAGHHRIDLTGSVSPLRKACFWIAVLTLVLQVAWVFTRRATSRTDRNHGQN